MPSLPIKIIQGLRTQGPIYLFRGPYNELVHPRLSITRNLRKVFVKVADTFTSSSSDLNTWSAQGMQFFYDLGSSPVTFDFASYLAAAEVERRLRKLEAIDVVFVLGSHHGVRKELPDYEAALDVETRLARLRNILVPMLSFLPTVRSYAVCGNREQAGMLITPQPRQLYPSDYRVFLPRQPSKYVIHEHARAGVQIWPMLRATESGRRFVREFFARTAAGRHPVVITVRQQDYSPVRNSRISDWIAFADGLDRAKYIPVFVRDTETMMRPAPTDFGDHIMCDAASWSLEVRMALYEAAWLNMALMHGPLELCWYNENARYVLFLAKDTANVTSETTLIENGHKIGRDLDFATPYQRIIWQPDKLSAIREGFAEMEKILPN